MSPSLPESSDVTYVSLLTDLKTRIRSARVRAATSINRELINLYWSIGKDILERQQAEGWGARTIDRLSVDLLRDFPEIKGLSPRNLKYMRAFAEAFPEQEVVQQVVAQLPWGQVIELIGLKSEIQRLFYANQAIKNGWSRQVLVHQIEGDLFARQGKAITNFERTLPSPQSDLARDLLKDPYSFDFLAFGPEMSERELERGLLDNLRALILELGKGFAFVGSQYHLEVGGQDYYIDLLFYHLNLRCFVVIELKIEEFKPEFAGKMNFYLSAVDSQLKHETDAPTIGIILCKGKNEVIVEYALRDSTKPMGVTEYRVSAALPDQIRDELPTVEEFARDFPLMDLVRLRIEIERAIRDLLRDEGDGTRPSPVTLTSMIPQVVKMGVEIPDIQVLRDALNAMNRAAHGLDVDPDEAHNATNVATNFLEAIRRI